MDLLKLFWAVVHSSAHPDTAFITVSVAGYKGLALYWMVAGISSLATLVLFCGNKIFLSGIGYRMTFFVKIRNFSNRTMEKVGFVGLACSLVKNLKYTGLAIISFVPVIVGIREASLFAAQALGMQYALPVVLLVNGVRLYLLYIFGAALWEAAPHYLSSLFLFIRGLII